MLGAKLTEDNHRELLAMAAGKSKRDIEQLVASRFPRADVPARIRKLPAAPPRVDRQQPLASAGAPRRSPPAPPPAPAGHVPPRRPAGRTDAVDPLSADRFRVQFTASRGQVDKLRQLQELVSHQVPDGDLADVIERAVDALTKRLLAERFGKSGKPRRARSGAGRSRRVPAAVRRAVLDRDGGRCAFVDGSGRRCEERRFLELDHVQPVGMGGDHSVSNVRILCRQHNRHAARAVYGAERIEAAVAAARRRRPGPA